MNWLGLDIGGANLKAADGRGWARVVPFELWRTPAGLTAALDELLHSAPAADGVAVTMTAELCDCFSTKADGVQHILTAVEHVATNREATVYLVDGRLVSIAEAWNQPQLAAASNWHALAQYACRFIPARTGILIDIGSTTTDIIPLIDGQPSTIGHNDTDRLVAGELVYTGVGRTPVCAIIDWLPYRDKRCPVAAELFATAADAYVVLGQLPEREDFTGTADGRPLTKPLSRARLARMICADSTTFSESDAELAATHIRDAQVAQLASALEKVTANVPCPPGACVLSGSGECLAKMLVCRQLPATPIVSLAERLGPAVSAAGPAHALAVLANDFEAASGNSNRRGKT
jgi:(4-(4-[2-(gamma-L-glutamylamino)ethyl]phenoxymethyl)furan-2-yl)methanamine synthase